jgi:metallophosphoesterase (TIGR00282 family)
MEIVPYLTGSDRVVRPANMGAHAPGKGLAVVPARDGTPVAVINVIGSLFIQTPISLWEQIDGLVEEAHRRAKVIIVDIHAEATSEKVALAHWLEGKVTLVVGTHTHVQTNDARVLPGGTAALTDAGMTGPHDSVIGVQKELAIRRMRTNLPVRFETASGDVRIEGVLVESDSDGRANSSETVRVNVG